MGCHQQQRCLAAGQVVLKPFYDSNVKMIGRSSEKKHVRLSPKHAHWPRALLLTPPESVDYVPKIMQAKDTVNRSISHGLQFQSSCPVPRHKGRQDLVWSGLEHRGLLQIADLRSLR